MIFSFSFKFLAAFLRLVHEATGGSAPLNQSFSQEERTEGVTHSYSTLVLKSVNAVEEDFNLYPLVDGVYFAHIMAVKTHVEELLFSVIQLVLRQVDVVGEFLREPEFVDMEKGQFLKDGSFFKHIVSLFSNTKVSLTSSTM